jgi:hypothetical protein
MLRRSRRPDPTAITFSVVEAVAYGDGNAILAAAEPLQALSAEQVFSALGGVFSRISGALGPSEREILREELRAASGGNDVRSAVVEIGEAALVSCNAKDAAHAIIRQAQKFGNDQENWAGVIWETVEAAGRFWGRCEIRANWAHSGGN